MKRTLILFINLIFVICLVGCKIEDDNIENDGNNPDIALLEKGNVLVDKQIISLLENDFNSGAMNESSYIVSQYRLEDKINQVNLNFKNFYLIDYNCNGKYYCGYIPENVKNQVEDKLWIKSDDESLWLLTEFTSGIKALLNRVANFKFEDIIWIEYDDENDILYENENYYLLFAYKINEVKVIEDIYGNIYNQDIKDVINLKITLYENKVYFANYTKLESGKYLLYGENIKDIENYLFNVYFPRSWKLEALKLYYLNKLTDDNLVIDYIELNYDTINLSINALEDKYGIYKLEFENIIKKTEMQGSDIIGYWDYEEYKKLLVEIIDR